MKKFKLKGFTIIELVIVIGVIGILSAVLIPTFIHLMDKANISKDMALIRNLNTSLAIDLKEHPTMRSALQTLDGNGFAVDNIKAAKESNRILWDSKNDVFCYLHDNGTIEYIPDNSNSLKYTRNESPLTYDKNKVNDVDYWVITNSVDDKYSTYYIGQDVNGNLNISKGFDAGSASIKSLTYTTTSNQTVVVVTNGGTLTIDALNSTIDHFGNASNVSIIKCDNESYTEYGRVLGTINIAQGHLVITNAENVENINITAKSVEESSAVKIDVKGTISDKTNYVTKTKNATIADSVSINFNDDPTITKASEEFEDFVKDSSKCSIHDVLGIFESYDECVEAYETAGESALLSDLVTLNPTCTQNGSKSVYCTVCAALLYSEELTALGHDYIHHDAHAATCTEVGHEEYSTCSRCDFTNYVEISALGHDWGTPTYTWNGDSCTARRVCTRDENHFEEEVVTGIYTQTAAATCTTASQGKLTATFTNPAFAQQETTKNGVVSALGHDLTHHNAVAATCTTDGHNAYDTCSRCDYSTYQLIHALGHDFTHHNAVAATCTTDGHNAYDSCSRCDYSTYQIVHATGHNMGTPVYTWNGTECTAERTCQNAGCNHKDSENAHIESDVIQERSNTLPEITRYTAEFNSSYFETQTKDVETAGVIVPIQSDLFNYNQMNEKAKQFIENVTYDPDDTTTSHVLEYDSASYRRDEPNAGVINLVAGTLTVTDGGTNISYTETVSAGPYSFYNLTPGVDSTYVVKDANGNTLQTGTLHPTGQLRMIKLAENTFNIRDIGGWECDGGTLNYNLIIRGSQVDNTHNYNITVSEAEYNRYLKIIGIKDEIDLRTPDPVTTVSYLGSGIDYHQFTAVAYYPGIKQSNSGNVGTWKNIISLIASDLAAGKPIYLHCSEGADRTGTIIFLLEAICGVSESDLDKDFELTSLKKNGGDRLRTHDITGVEYISMKQYLKQFYGDTFMDKVINYMLAIGVTMDEINAIRAALINSSSSTTLEQHNFFDKNMVCTADNAVIKKLDCRVYAINEARISGSAKTISKLNGNPKQFVTALIPCSPGDIIHITSNSSIFGGSYCGKIWFFTNDYQDENLAAYSGVHTYATNSASGGASLPSTSTTSVTYTVPTSYTNAKSFRATIAYDDYMTDNIKIYVVQKGIKS